MSLLFIIISLLQTVSAYAKDEFERNVKKDKHQSLAAEKPHQVKIHEAFNMELKNRFSPLTSQVNADNAVEEQWPHFKENIMKTSGYKQGTRKEK